MPAKSALPNLLSATRLVLTAPVVYAITSGRWRAAAALLVAAGLTDGLDGLLARRWKASTRLGAYLDPAADKTLLNGAFLALGFAGALPWWLVGLVFGRDVLILTGALAVWRLKGRRDFAPSVWGKWCTFGQILAATAAILERAWPHWGLSPALPPVVWLAALVTLWSGLDYARRAFH